MMTVAVLDACILYSPALRDLLMYLTKWHVYQPKWTETIHDEWTRNVLANRPDLSLAQIQRTRELMNVHGLAWQCQGYEALIPTLTLPDSDDRHVLAAAIAGGASHIVTFNLSDFPAEALAPYGIAAVHPDPFLVELLAQKPEAFRQAVRELLASLRNPPRTWQEQLQIMQEQGLPQTAQNLAVKYPTA